jgi:hypothetical protein
MKAGGSLKISGATGINPQPGCTVLHAVVHLEEYQVRAEGPRQSIDICQRISLHRVSSKLFLI